MAQGKTIVEWCTERNLSPISTYRTLSGLEKGRNGKAFESLTAIRGYLQTIEIGER
jgi:gp16 family phage-associated protein